MESWFIIVIASTLIYSFVTLLDRRVMAMRMISPIAYLLLGNISGLIFIAFFFFQSFDNINFRINLIILGIIVGILFGAFTYLYFLTLQKASPVATVAYMQIVPAITTIASIFWLGESISEYGFVAILLLSVGLTFISLLDKKLSGHVAGMMVPAVILLSIGYVIQKFLLAQYPVVFLIVLNRLGATIFGLLIFFWEKKINNVKMSLDIKSNPKGAIAAVVGELGSIIGLYFLLLAYNQGPFAEVSAIAATLPVAVLLGAVVMSSTTKETFWEIPEIRSPGNLLLTAAASLLICLSIYIISGIGITHG